MDIHAAALAERHRREKRAAGRRALVTRATADAAHPTVFRDIRAFHGFVEELDRAAGA